MYEVMQRTPRQSGMVKAKIGLNKLIRASEVLVIFLPAVLFYQIATMFPLLGSSDSVLVSYYHRSNGLAYVLDRKNLSLAWTLKNNIPATYLDMLYTLAGVVYGFLA